MRLPVTLYKLDSKGKNRVWTISTNGATYTVLHGAEGGKLVSSTVTCEGKNQGRANETSPTDQAVKEALALVDKKLKSGYSDSPTRTTYSDLYKPMLARELTKVVKDLDDLDHISQPKYDGIRCVARKEGSKIVLMSRNLRELRPIPHIQSALTSFFKDNPDLVLDGELYIHNEEFHNISGIVRKENSPLTEKLTYVVYDTFDPGCWYTRTSKVSDVFEIPELDFKVSSHVLFSPHDMVDGKDTLYSAHELYLSHGFEGTILRDPEAEYKPGSRSKGLLKYKNFYDQEYKILDVVDSRGNQEGCAKLICEANNGETFGCQVKGDFKLRKEVLSNKQDYIGKLATVQYFEVDSVTNIPRFPVCIGFPWDKHD